MAWADPVAGETFFQVNDIPTEANYVTYLFGNLLALPHFYGTWGNADLDVNTTVAETTLMPATQTIVGNDMGATGRLYWEAIFDMQTNVLGTLILRLKLGATTIVQSAAWTPGNAIQSATRVSGVLRAWVENRNATNAQLGALQLLYSSVGSGNPATTGVGSFDPSNTTSFGGVITNTSAVDTTVNQALDVTAQWSVSNAALSFRVRSSKLYLAKV